MAEANAVFKRLFDACFASLVLLITLPLFLGAAIGIKIGSPGPILFRAERVGRDALVFTMLKFRTMHVRCDAGPVITAPDDSRIFAFGSMLRKTKIDELPQFLNVLVGDMSITGPRPEDPKIVTEHYTNWMKETLNVRPGVTSPGALWGYTHGEHLLDAEDPEGSYVKRQLPIKLAIERVYLDRASFRNDLGVIFRTISTVFFIITGKSDIKPPNEIHEIGRWLKTSRK